MTAATANPATAADPENTAYIKLSTGGTITWEFLPDIAPDHVARIKQLARDGFYNGIVFHRVIDGFMAQTGDPTGTGMGGSDLPDLNAEFSDYAYKRGTVGMARTQDPNSANSQFFICFTDSGCGFLTGQYTVFAQVTEGMEEVDKIARGEPPASPDKIESFTIASDLKPAGEAAPSEAAEEVPTEKTAPAEAEEEAPAEDASSEHTSEEETKAE
ncbi:MAG: peptidylprolyl isomerase [Pseudomonadota bacterium]